MSLVGSQFGSIMSAKVYCGFGGAVGYGAAFGGAVGYGAGFGVTVVGLGAGVVVVGATGATGAFGATGATGAGLPGDELFSPALKLMHPAGILTFGPGTGQTGVPTLSQTYLFVASFHVQVMVPTMDMNMTGVATRG